MLNLGERRRPGFHWTVLQKFCGPSGIAAAGSTPDNAPDDLAIEQKIVTARSKLNKLVGHRVTPSLLVLLVNCRLGSPALSLGCKG
jgi:hypothetical protein